MSKRMIIGVMTMVCLLSAVACDRKEDVPDRNTSQGYVESADTVGEMITNDFQRIMSETPNLTASEIAESICANPNLMVDPIVMPVEPGYLNGFQNARIEGFSEGAMFAPMIGAIPFVGYVFVLEEGTDVGEFMNHLTQNADLNWNVCTSADEMIVKNENQVVLFAMCPKSFEE